MDARCRVNPDPAGTPLDAPYRVAQANIEVPREQVGDLIHAAQDIAVVHWQEAVFGAGG